MFLRLRLFVAALLSLASCIVEPTVDFAQPPFKVAAFLPETDDCHALSCPLLRLSLFVVFVVIGISLDTLVSLAFDLLAHCLTVQLHSQLLPLVGG